MLTLYEAIREQHCYLNELCVGCGSLFLHASLSNQLDAGVTESLKQIVHRALVHLCDGRRHLVEPGLDDGTPAEGGWLHVDHAAA